jgi:hypothetical protein
MDSLGSAHPKVGSVLSSYLFDEARDKKGQETFRNPVYRKSQVRPVPVIIHRF